MMTRFYLFFLLSTMVVPPCNAQDFQIDMREIHSDTNEDQFVNDLFSQKLQIVSSESVYSELWQSDRTLDTVEVFISERAAPPGAVFGVPIFVRDDVTPYRILSMEFTLTFDVGILSFQGVTPGSIVPQSHEFESGYGGNKVYVATAGEDTLRGKGTLTRVQFQVRPTAQEGQTGIFSFQRFQFNEPPGVGPVAKYSDAGFVVGSFPHIELSAVEHDFGESPVGDSVYWELDISNIGWSDLVVKSIIEPFREFGVVAPSFPTVVEPDSFITTTIYFAPADAGVRNGVLIVASNDYFEKETTVSLRGKGIAPDIALSAREHSFGEVTVGYPTAWAFDMYNRGNTPLHIDSAHVYPSAFHWLLPTFPQIIGIGDSLSASLQFMPAEIGLVTGVLSIYSNDPDENPIDVFLHGIGIPPEPDIFIPSTNYDFGGVYIGRVSSWTMPILNVGTSGLTIDSVVSSGGEFEVISFPSALTIHPAGRIDVSISFQPAMQEPVSGTVAIFSNDPDESLIIVTVTGEGLKPATLTVLGGSGKPGTVANIVPIAVDNHWDIASLEFVLAFPESVLTVTGAIPAERSQHMETFQVDLHHGLGKVKVAISDQSQSIPAGIGGVTKFAFSVAADAPQGDYPLILSEVTSFDTEGREISFLLQDSVFSIHTVGVEDTEDLLADPLTYALYQNYPNPFNPSTSIQYSVADHRSRIHVTLAIVNVLGQKVKTLVDEPRKTGVHTVTWNGKDDAGFLCASGVYLYLFQAGTYTQWKRMLLLK